MIACPHCPHRPASIEALDAHVAAVHGRPCNVCDGIGYFGNPADGINCEACRGSGRVMAVAIAKEEPPAAVHGKGVFRLVRVEPSEEILHAMDEAYMPFGEMLAVHDALLAASPPPTDAEIDDLCIAYAYSNPHGPEWWWRKNTKGKLAEYGEPAEQARDEDRARMRAFIAALEGRKP